MLRLQEAVDKLERANGVRCYDHALRRPKENVLMKEMVHEVDEKYKEGRLRMKWMESVDESIRWIGLRKEDEAGRCRWRESVRKIFGSSEMHPVTSIHWKY